MSSWLDFIFGGEGGGSSVTVESLNVTANGTYTAPTGKAYSPVDVSVSGSSGVEEKDVNFYDYDGTCVASYTAADFASLDALPANPSHDGLTAQGWNWSLADAKTYVASYGILDIGQMYETTDGKTWFDIEVPENSPSNRWLVTLKFAAGSGTSITVNWGDGSSEETFSETTSTAHTHNYSGPGDYRIKLDNQDGNIRLGDNNYPISGVSYPLGAIIKAVYLGKNVVLTNRVFQNEYSLQTIVIPKNISLSGKTYVFSSCYALKAAIIPTGITGLSDRLFESCYGMTVVSLPKNIGTSLNSYAFNACKNLKRFCIPDSVTTIYASAIGYLEQIASIKVPASVTSLKANALGYERAIGEFRFYRTTPPTMEAVSALAPNNTNNTDWKIVVPYSEDHSVLNEYQTASTWTNYSSNMVEASQ